MYRVTIQLVQKAKAKGQSGTFVFKSTGGFAQAEWSPCRRVRVLRVGNRHISRGWLQANCSERVSNISGLSVVVNGRLRVTRGSDGGLMDCSGGALRLGRWGKGRGLVAHGGTP